MENFEVLQNKKFTSRIISAAASASMDLIAVLTVDGILNIYRTITWENILQKSTSSLFDDDKELANNVLFSYDGDLVLSGWNNLAILSIETGTTDIIKDHLSLS